MIVDVEKEGNHSSSNFFHLNQNCLILGINQNFVGFKILLDFSIG